MKKNKYRVGDVVLFTHELSTGVGTVERWGRVIDPDESNYSEYWYDILVSIGESYKVDEDHIILESQASGLAQHLDELIAL